MVRPSWWSLWVVILLMGGGFSGAPIAQATPVVTTCYVTTGDTSSSLAALTLPGTEATVLETLLGGDAPLGALVYWPGPDGGLYTVSGDWFGLVDASTGLFAPASQPLGQGNGRLGMQLFDNGLGLTVDPFTGTIYASVLTGGLDLLIQVDPQTGGVVLGAFGPPHADYAPIQTPPKLGDISAIAIDPFDGQMYAAASDGAAGSPSWLIRINKSSGQINTVGPLGSPVSGLSFTNEGDLWGVSDGKLYRLHKESGGILAAYPLTPERTYGSLACLTGAVNQISGRLFGDVNGNGLLDGDETGTPGVAVQLRRDITGDDQASPKNPVVATAVTDAQGGYAFTLAATGNFLLYVDRKELPRHHTLTTDSVKSLFLEGVGQVDGDHLFGHVNNRFVPDEVIVRFKPPMDHQAAATLLAQHSLRIERYMPALQAYLVAVPPGTTDAVIDLLLTDPYVLYAEANYVVEGLVNPDDPDFNDPAKVYAPHILQAPVAWDISTGSDGVVVAVIDTGISPTHPEFSGRLLTGYDFVNGDADARDDHGHGTHVAGILAAAINNGEGMVGIAPTVSILPVKVLNAQNSGTWADIAAGITYAVDRGAKVLNLSLGGRLDSQILIDAIQYAAGRGVLMVAAAGNSTTDAPFYPASYVETVGVAATTAGDARWSGSNYGSYIEVAAPGDQIWSATWATEGDTYGFLSGTSMAAPHVSGLAALILSERPELSATDVRTIIRQSAVDLGEPGWDELFGYGRIQVGETVSEGQRWTPPTATPTPTPTPAPYVQRVNVGGTTFTDGQGQSWAADKAYAVGSWGYSTGSAKSYTTAVAGTTDDLLYQKQRELAGEYRFTVPNGIYHVTLKFAEFSARKTTDRSMNIIMEAAPVESNFSVFGIVGKAAALDRAYTVTVNDGILNIVFSKGSGARYSPAVSAIDVKVAAPLPPTPTPTPTATPCTTCPTATPTRTATPTATPSPTPTAAPYTQLVNVGSTTFTDSQGQSWAADKAYAVGSWGYSTSGRAKSYTTAVADTTDDLLYQKQRELAGEYRFTVPNGAYEITLKFAEFGVTSTTRAMKISMEGVVVEESLSVWGLVGKAVALDRTYSVTVSDGILNIAFAKASGAKSTPAISAIGVRSR